ncbi:MAG: FtsW/RodA/SpoVE family cell cycle protein [Gammaproteobacteria bacterium]|nr:FtsW/RodA/SpoVE family cell cycle protein [Gammaproteobacteria bacterium]
MTMARPAHTRLHERSTQTPALTWPVDPVLLLTATFLLVTGIVMVASASSEISARMHDAPFYHVRQAHRLCCVLRWAPPVLRSAYQFQLWQRLSWPLLAVGFALLVAVLIPGIGKTVNGSTRWISLGAFSLQGSEFVKLFSVVFMASYLVRYGDSVRERFAGFVKPIAIISALVLLLLGQPDFGASVVIMGTTLGMMFLAGASLAHFLPMIAAGRHRWCQFDCAATRTSRPSDCIYRSLGASVRGRLSAHAGIDRLWSRGVVRARSR